MKAEPAKEVDPVRDVYLIRHGEPDWQWAASMRFFGPSANFIRLTGRGIAQIERTARDPRLSGADFILSSPYTRALQSAQILSRRLDLPVQVDWDIHEWLYDRGMRGDLPPEGSPYSAEDMMRCFERCVRLRGTVPDGRDPETASMIRERALRALGRIPDGKKVLVVCHEGVICSLTGRKSADLGEIVPFPMA